LEAIIDQAIAIIVDAIADLWFGLSCSATRPPFTARHTGLSAITTGAFTGSSQVVILFCAGYIVDISVTIVIQSIADLFGGGIGDVLHSLVQFTAVIGLVVFSSTCQSSTA
jgi:hypothetical protein